MRRAIGFLLAVGLVLGADLAAVKAEPNLEKRAEKALVYAGEVVTAMRGELDRNDVEKIQAQLKDFEAAVELAVDSLKATGKNARRSPKHFKKTELRLRELLRRLETLRQDMSLDDRPVLDGVKAQLEKRIDELVEATLRGA